MNKNSFYLSLYNKIESFKPNVLEIICFVLYIISTITLSCFHEPWFDEFQSWGISKDSIYNILFVIPHYEAHPPLWHLILKCFTSFDIPAELSIKIPNLLLMFASVWLLLFKSPFPRIIRLVLPFTYFIFYQYAVVSRPYSMLTFALFLSATLNCSKNEKPFRYIVSLGFLALTSLYGMVIATGLTLIWVYEIWNKQDIIIFIKSFLKDKRFYAMLSLFFLCLAISILILPDKNVYAKAQLSEVPILLKVLYHTFCIIADATLLNIFDYTTSFFISMNILTTSIYCLIGIYLTYNLYINFKQNNSLKFFILFYILIIFFWFYFSPHHIGIIFTFLISSFWMVKSEILFNFKSNKFFNTILVLTLIIQFSWSIQASFNEILLDYSSSRKIYNFIKANSLNKYKIFSEWDIKKCYTNEKGEKYFNEHFLNKNITYKETLVENTKFQIPPVLINPYFNKNIFSNFNIQDKKMLYIEHYKPETEETKYTKKLWYNKGCPDIIIARNTFSTEPFFEYLKDYFLITSFDNNFIIKNTVNYHLITIYVHKDKYLEIKEIINRKQDAYEQK